MQMICSCCFLYMLRRWKVISFTVGESLSLSDNAASMVPMKTLKQTSPLAGAYLLYMVYFFVGWEFVDALSLSYISDAFELQYFFLKVSYYGVCSWSKCSYVYYPKADHSCFHNGCRVSSCRTKVFIFSCWKVRFSSARCINVPFLNFTVRLSFENFKYTELIS